jgi:Flp pilus assembly protein TadD
LVTFAAFVPVLGADFVDWDDNRNFLENPYYRGLSGEHLRWMFTTTKMGHYQPLSWVTLGLDYALWGMDARGYHLTNLLLHCATALSFYFLAARLLVLAVPGARRSGWSLRLCAALAAALFAVHPLRVESVAWITERRDVLSGLFFVLTIVAYLRSVAVPSQPLPAGRQGSAVRLGWYLASMGLLALSLLSKSWGMTMPAVLVILDVYPLRRVGGASGGWFTRQAALVWLQKVPFLALAVLAAFQAANAQANQFQTLKTLAEYGVIARLGQAAYGLGFYVCRTLLPVGLGPIYEIPAGFTGLELTNIVSGLCVVAITVSLIAFRKRQPAALAVWAYYVAVVSPVLGLAQSGPQLVKDSYTYLSCMGWGLLLAGGLLRLWAGRGRGEPGAKTGASHPSPERKRGVQDHDVSGGPVARAPGSVGLALVAVVLCVLGGLTWRQAAFWKDSETLFRRALAVRPNSYNAHNNLGTLLRKDGRIAEAVKHYRAAIAIKPDEANAHYNLANALKLNRRYEEAVTEYRRAVELNPLQPAFHFNCANTLANNLGRPEQALEHYREALRLKGLPRAVASRVKRSTLHYCIAFELRKLGRLEEARRHLEACLRLDPDHPQALKLKRRLDGE